MVKKQDYGGLIWLDLEQPNEAELKEVVADRQIHPLAAAELAAPSARSKVDLYSNFIYLILHFPICNLCYGEKGKNGADSEEIDFIIGRDFLITVHYQAVDGLGEFSKIFTANYLRGANSDFKPHGGHLFYYLVKHLYNSLAPGLDHINDVLKQAERKIFAGEEKAMVRLLSSVNRDLLDFRWTLEDHRHLLNSLGLGGQDFFGQEFRYYLASLLGEYEKIWSLVKSNRETFFDLRQTNDSLLSIKNNETMKVLAVLAFIFFPLTVITQFFGMSVNLPLVGALTAPYDYLLVTTLMILVVVIMFVWARSRRWL